jgi:putative ABC transport system permease protein
MDSLWQDMKYGFRTLLRNRGVTAIAVLTMAIGIGVNTAVFSIADAVMLRPLPFAQPERLVRIWESSPQRNFNFFSVSQPNFLDWREQNRSFERIAATTGRAFNLTGGDAPERIPGISVTVDFFPALGIQPALGRAFRPEEDAPGTNARVVVMSHGLWERRFASDPQIVNKTVALNDLQYTVIGVLPRGFRWGTADLFTPLAPNPAQSRSDHRLSVVGRLKPGVTLDQATAEMVGIAAQLERQYPDSNGGYTVRLRSFYDWLVPEESRRSLLILLGAVGLVLLIACANVANLTLARASARRRELAVRSALGAGASRLARQLLTESIMVSLAGGALGLAVAAWGARILRASEASGLPRLDEIALDLRVLGFTLAISMLTGILFGVAPALQAARTDTGATLKEGGHSGLGQARHRTRSVLVVAEVALSMMLLVGAGLLLRSFWAVLQIQPGYTTHNVLTANISLPNQKYPSAKEYVTFHRDLIARLEALPGVKSASVASGIPADAGGTLMEVYFDDRPPLPKGQQASAQWRLIGPGYFRTLGIPLLRGRDLNENDISADPNNSLRGAVVSKEMADRYWPNEDPVGRRFHPWATGNPPLTVVGVVGNVRLFGLEADPEPVVYLNFAAGTWNPMNVVLRSEVPAATMAGPLRDTVRAIDPNLPVASVRTMEERVDGTLSPRRFQMMLLGAFAATALGLAAVGLFGVMAFVVARRTHEIGIRIALGAGRGEIFGLVLRHGMLLVGLGIVVGTAGALALTRYLSTLLFQVKERDPLTFAVTATVLAVASFAACWIPARRAVSVDPLVALRWE